MIRLIIKELSSDYDGKTHQNHKTFDVDLPKVEAYLRANVGYAQCGSREIIGAELIDENHHPNKGKEENDEQ